MPRVSCVCPEIHKHSTGLMHFASEEVVPNPEMVKVEEIQMQHWALRDLAQLISWGICRGCQTFYYFSY